MNKKETIYEKFHEYTFVDDEGDMDYICMEYAFYTKIVELFDWFNKKEFIAKMKNRTPVYYEDAEEEDMYPIIAEKDKMFYCSSSGTYVGNLWGVIGYRYSLKYPKKYKKFLDSLKNNKEQKKTKRDIYSRFELMDFEV